LSNFEANLAYKDVSDPSVVVSFPLVDKPEESFLAWTTTPWTLPSNLALCVHPEMDYVRVKDKMNGSIYILAESRLVQIYPPKKKKKKSKKKKSKKGADTKEEEKKDGGDDLDYEILSRCKGKDLEGKKYVPLFPYFKDRAESMNNFRVLTDTFVTDESGTGIVHMAPAFGEDDYRICAENKIISGSYKTLPCPVDGSGRFTEVVKDFVGLHVKDKKDAADEKICRWLKERKRLVKKNA
jgi:isoleucyl-tRNA synthetase